MATDKKLKIPKAIGACADELYRTRQQRYALQKEVEKLEKHESALEEHIIQTLPKSEASGVAGKVARVHVEGKDVPQIKDWPALCRYVKKSGQFDLLQRRLSRNAVVERWEAKQSVPGVEKFQAKVVHLNKL